MNKYEIEDNIDFFSELQTLKDIEEPDDAEYCLISQEKLTDYYVKLECGHTFNYIPLYNDLVNHKNKFNLLEANATKCESNEFRCPYCRKHHKTLLPYYEELNLPIKYGINSDKLCDKPIQIIRSCEFKMVDAECLCGKSFSTKISVKQDGQYTTFGDNKFYCIQHKALMIKKYRVDFKKAKLLKLQNDFKEPTQNATYCQIILKTGQNKGKPCCKPSFKNNVNCEPVQNDDHFCKRHFDAFMMKNNK